MATMTIHRVEGFIAMTADRRWGWGETPSDALKECRRQGGGTVKGSRLVYKLPTGAVNAYVDQMGSICWDWADDAPDRNASGEYVERPSR